MNVSHPRNRRAFTIVELLVVIGIIAILVSILVPVVGKMRQTGYKTDTASQLSVIRTALEMYHQTFQAYPGPYSNQEILNAGSPGDLAINVGGQRITLAENLVLGLSGGLERRPNDNKPRYDRALVGTGPRVLVAANPKRYEPFITTAPGWLSTGQFKEPGNAKPSCQDSFVPEFVDRYPTQPMPILYLRARVGAPGIINGDNPKDLFQYDIRQITPYTDATFYSHIQGLRTVGNDMTAPLIKGINNDALPYFRNTALCGNGTDQKQTGVPMSKDGYILISAGQDRIYGTPDDITSFGNVGE